jgi:hypothetical protein
VVAVQMWVSCMALRTATLHAAQSRTVPQASGTHAW